MTQATPELIAAFQANAAQFNALVAQLTGDVVAPPPPPPVTGNTYISRSHPGSLVSADKGGSLAWGMYGDQHGMTEFRANGSSSTQVLGTKLVLQDGNAYAKQLDGTWVLGTRFGPAATTVVVVDPAP